MISKTYTFGLLFHFLLFFVDTPAIHAISEDTIVKSVIEVKVLDGYDNPVYGATVSIKKAIPDTRYLKMCETKKKTVCRFKLEICGYDIKAELDDYDPHTDIVYPKKNETVKKTMYLISNDQYKKMEEKYKSTEKNKDKYPEQSLKEIDYLIEFYKKTRRKKLLQKCEKLKEQINISKNNFLSWGLMCGFFGFGVNLDINLSNQISIYMEPIFLMKYPEVKDYNLNSSNGEETSFVKNEIKLFYIDVPLLLKINSSIGNIQLYFLAGPSFGLLITAEQNQTTISDHFKKFNFSLDLGVGLKFPIKDILFFIEVHYDYGITNINVSENDPAINTRGLRIMFGVSPKSNQ